MPPHSAHHDRLPRNPSRFFSQTELFVPDVPRIYIIVPAAELLANIVGVWSQLAIGESRNNEIDFTASLSRVQQAHLIENVVDRTIRRKTIIAWSLVSHAGCPSPLPSLRSRPTIRSNGPVPNNPPITQ